MGELNGSNLSKRKNLTWLTQELLKVIKLEIEGLNFEKLMSEYVKHMKVQRPSQEAASCSSGLRSKKIIHVKKPQVINYINWL